MAITSITAKTGVEMKYSLRRGAFGIDDVMFVMYPRVHPIEISPIYRETDTSAVILTICQNFTLSRHSGVCSFVLSTIFSNLQEIQVANTDIVNLLWLLSLCLYTLLMYMNVHEGGYQKAVRAAKILCTAQ